MKNKKLIRWCPLVFTAAFALFCTLLRALQLKRELLVSGSVGAGSSTALTVLTLLFLALLPLLLRPLKKRGDCAQVFTGELTPCVLQLLAAAGLIVGNLLLWLSDSAPVSALYVQTPEVTRVLSAMLPPLGIVSGLCIGAFALACRAGKRPTPLLYMAASVYLIVRLILCFQSWNTDPSIWNYCFQLLAAISCMLATFQLAGFCFGRGRRRVSLYWCLCAVVFCSINVADTVLRSSADDIVVNFALLLSLAVSAVQLLFARKKRPS